jgi:pimeloyl-ACP methyl ester carboxylesterase
MVVMGAGDTKKAEREVFAYSEEQLMKQAGAYFKGRMRLMPEPQRWNESLKMLNDLYNKDFVSEETLTKIKCPVLIMSGDADSYSNPESSLSAFRLIPNAKLSIIPACGHVIFSCNFPAVWESMKAFVAKQ